MAENGQSGKGVLGVIRTCGQDLVTNKDTSGIIELLELIKHFLERGELSGIPVRQLLEHVSMDTTRRGDHTYRLNLSGEGV